MTPKQITLRAIYAQFVERDWLHKTSVEEWEGANPLSYVRCSVGELSAFFPVPHQWGDAPDCAERVAKLFVRHVDWLGTKRE